MPGIPKRNGPTALTTTLTTNLMQGGQGDADRYDIVTHIHLVNKTTQTAKFSMWIGGANLNVAGTEFFNGKAVLANDVYDWYGRMILKSTEYIVGGSDTANALTFEIESEQYVVP